MADAVPPHVWTQRRRVIWASLVWAMSLPVVVGLIEPDALVVGITTAGGVVTLIVGTYAATAAWDDKNRSRAAGTILHEGIVR